MRYLLAAGAGAYALVIFIWLRFAMAKRYD